MSTYTRETSMSTYTIAYHRGSGMLLACVKDGDDILAAIEQSAGEGFPAEEIEILRGLTLTSSPQDGDKILYSSGCGRLGWLSDENDETYDYAVMRAVIRA